MNNQNNILVLQAKECGQRNEKKYSSALIPLPVIWLKVRRQLANSFVAILLSLTALLSHAVADELLVFPPATEASPIDLTGADDYQSIVVVLRKADGVMVDVTDAATMKLSGQAIARIKKNRLTPTSDGKATLVVKYDGHTINLPIHAKFTQRQRPPSFKLDVMPVLLRAGCNSGSCHGASRGQNGFRLSVFGFDPAADFKRIVQEANGRRVDLKKPEQSLILLKPLGEHDHGGGERFTKDSELYRKLHRWLSTGAKPDTPKIQRPVEIEIYPKQLLAIPNRRTGTPARLRPALQFMVRAKYDDGSDRDVTALTVFSSNDPTVAAVDESGVVTPLRQGESFLLARFDDFTVGAPIIVVPPEHFEWPKVHEFNYIDRLVHQKLKRLRIAPSEICTDHEFLRRVYIDLIGLPPTTTELEKFLADENPNKRKVVVDQLLARPEFTDIQVMRWAELLQINRIKGGFFEWLSDHFNERTPIDQMVREILVAEGGFFRDPPVQYFQHIKDPKKLAENVAQVFLGTRIQCAQCHNHPFDRWTMDDYYGFAAFFSQLKSKRAGEDSREMIVFNAGTGEMKHPSDDRTMSPRFLGGAKPVIKGRDRREVLAQWLTSPENDYFARNLVNVAWAQLFGIGIIEPVDDVRISNPPSNPELLDELARRLIAYKYDFRKLMRDICNSRTYQLSTTPTDSNKHDDHNFARASFRRLRAEVFHDCICHVTEQPTRFGGFPLGTRAVQLPVSRMSTYFLKTFGRSTRESVCSCEVDTQPNLSQALHLINGNTAWPKIESGPVIKRLLKTKSSLRELTTDLYLRCLSRPPNDAEWKQVEKHFAETGHLKETLEDIFWALINSKEFLFNH